MNKTYILDGLSLSPFDDESRAFELAQKKLKSAGIAISGIEMNIFKKSVDARKREDIKLVYSVLIKTERSGEEHKFSRLGAREVVFDEFLVKHGDARMTARPLVVGMGPAGLFCALILAENGYRPIIIDRGDSVQDRVRAVGKFYSQKVLDTD